MTLRWLPTVLGLAMVILTPGADPAAAQDANAQWRASGTTCSETDRAACDRAVTLADQLFERTDRKVAIT